MFIHIYVYKIQCINTSIVNTYVYKYYFTVDNSLELPRDFEKSVKSKNECMAKNILRLS